MGIHPAKACRRRGRLWVGAVVGLLLGTIVTAVLLIPRRVEGPYGISFGLGFVDDAGNVYEPPRPRDRLLKEIGVSISGYNVGRSGEPAWKRIYVQLETRTPNPSGPLSGAAIAQIAEIVRRSEQEIKLWFSHHNIAPHEVSWEKVLAGQPAVWTEPQWPEIRRIAAIALSVGLAAGTAMFGLAAMVQYYLRKSGHCVQCGYDLTRLNDATTVCPECGNVRTTSSSTTR